MSEGKVLLQPQGERIVVVKTSIGEKTTGGVYLPLKTQEDQWIGEVVAVGPGRMNPDGSNQAMNVKVGDLVVPGRAIEREILLAGRSYIILRASDVAAILSGEVEAVEETK